MKFLSVVFSIITLLYMSNDLFSSATLSGKEKTYKDIVAFTAPQLYENKLEIEEDWIEKKIKPVPNKLSIDKKNSALKNKEEKPKDDAYPLLKIGGENYQLLGIFLNDDIPFILLKAKSSLVKKVVEGKEISSGIFLKKILANKITLSHSGEIIEFKLFERNNHA